MTSQLCSWKHFLMFNATDGNEILKIQVDIFAKYCEQAICNGKFQKIAVFLNN